MARPFWIFSLLSFSSNLLAQSFTPDTLNNFYNQYLPDQVNIVAEVYSSVAPITSLYPAPLTGYLPVVITNTTGLNPANVFVTLAGQQTPSDLTQYFFQLGAQGVMVPVAGSSTTYSPNYSYPLSSLPICAAGTNTYLLYVPNLNGARFYFSINHPMYLQSDTLTGSPPNQIVAPTYFAFYDPNYNNLFESVEVTFFPNGGGGGASIPWTASVNTTEVDAFGLPVQISYYSYSPSNPNAVTPLVQDPNALPSGFGVGGLAGATTRSTILTNVVNTLTSGDQTGASVWQRLAIPFYTNPYAATGLQTYLRVLSPKQSLGNAATPLNTGGLTNQHISTVEPGATQFKNYNYPPFPSNYLSSTSYGDSSGYLNSLFSYYTGSTNLYISTGGGNPTVYKGVATGSAGNYTLTFTGISGPDTGQVNTLTQSSVNTFNMFSGSQALTGGSDATDLGFYFGDTFTVGFLASSVGTSYPINITDAVEWQPAYIPSYYVGEYSISGGPWYDLYAKALHQVAVRNATSDDLNSVGLCYAYDFDDSLGISGTITPSILTANTLNPYLGITLGAVDTNIPNPYSDANTYSVEFSYPTGESYSLNYQQGSTTGTWIPVSSGTTLSNLVSNSTNPLYIQYTNGAGTSIFQVYLYYQFLVPIGTYNSNQLNVINSTTITPNSATPTMFTINLLP